MFSVYEVIKKKRDGLILDFFEVLKKAKTLRSELTEIFREAQQKMNLARVLESDLKIASIAMAMKNQPGVEVKTKNIMGVKVPEISSVELQKNFQERGYGIFNSSAISEAAAAYEKVVEKTVVAAETETALRNLLREIEKTKRRVNALEYVVIPEMEKVKSFITLRLEEMERETTFRMKMIKA